MARHNREARGVDQRGQEYRISYQPDWLRLIKVTRKLASGRQSTKTLFRNPTGRERSPGGRVRTRIASPAQKLDFEVALTDPRHLVKRIIVEAVVPGAEREAGTIVFTLEDDNPPAGPPR